MIKQIIHNCITIKKYGKYNDSYWNIFKSQLHDVKQGIIEGLDETKKNHYKCDTGYKDKNEIKIIEGDKLKVTDKEGTHIMVVSYSAYANDNNVGLYWLLEAKPEENGPGYWYYLDDLDKSDKETKHNIITTKQLEKIGSIYKK